jgi:hypothetical protein
MAQMTQRTSPLRSGKAPAPLPRSKAIYIAELTDRLGAAAEHTAGLPARRGYFLALQAALDHVVGDDVAAGHEFDALLGFVTRILTRGPQAREAL